MTFDPLEMAKSCLRALREIETVGKSLLEEDLKNSRPYNHEKIEGSYDAKNSYFERANVVGIPLLNFGATGLSKIYYWNMLNQIIAFEKSHFKLNKGMVSANLGVSDLAEGDIDGGIAHLLWSGYEDRAWIKDSYAHDVFQMKLYTQFANGENRGGLSQFGGPAPHAILENATKEYNTLSKSKLVKEGIFAELKDSDEHRAILEGALWTIARNIPILRGENGTIFEKNQNNIYTRLRLFNGMVDLCRFIEIRIRRHEKPPKEVRTLGDLLKYSFGKKSLTWFDKDVVNNIKTPQTGPEFDAFVKNSLGLVFPANSILLLWGTRNYSVHVCDPDTPYLFENFEKVLSSIICAYAFYLQFKGIV